MHRQNFNFNYFSLFSFLFFSFLFFFACGRMFCFLMVVYKRIRPKFLQNGNPVDKRQRRYQNRRPKRLGIRTEQVGSRNMITLKMLAV